MLHELSGADAAHRAGNRGGGVLLGVLDTGVDADHAEFVASVVPYRYVTYYPWSPYWPPRDVRGFDTDGHGTHVCGVLAGSTLGIAPEASLYVCSVIESESTATSLSRVLYGLDWILDRFSAAELQGRPGIVNLSLGFPSTTPPGITPTAYEAALDLQRRMMRTLHQANILPVAAIGNDGPGTFGYPAAFREVLAVGAVDAQRNVAGFSGGGTPLGEGVSKPDCVGFGVGVSSSLERIYDGQSVYGSMDGTSMASPYVAAVAALHRAAHPSESAADAHARILSTADPIPGQPADRVGAGLARYR